MTEPSKPTPTPAPPVPDVAGLQNAIEQLSNPTEGKASIRHRPPRRSMSTARQRFQTPEIPGYHCHWFKEDNVPLAIDAYYEFVDRDEVNMNQLNIAQGGISSGTDLGSRVSLIADKTESGSPVRAYLMKLPIEYWNEDRKEIDQMNSGIMQAIFGDEAKVDIGDGLKPIGNEAYRDTALFNRPARKAVRRRKGSR